MDFWRQISSLALRTVDVCDARSADQVVVVSPLTGQTELRRSERRRDIEIESQVGLSFYLIEHGEKRSIGQQRYIAMKLHVTVLL